MDYIIWCDESIENGKHFSNFYGGALVRSIDLENVENILKETKNRLNFKDEVKWTKVTENYLNKYIELINDFFNLIEQDKIKIRIMFTQNSKMNNTYSEYHNNNKFFLLYYQFIKHSFGLIYSNNMNEKVNLKIYFDRLPNKKVANEQFKEYIYKLPKIQEYLDSNLYIKKEDIMEADSHKHNVLQCLDIVLGAIAFKLNKLDEEKISGKRNRGKRTIAKEKLYKAILLRIRKIYPGFNIGISTGIKDNIHNFWLHPYRHWLFVPNEYK